MASSERSRRLEKAADAAADRADQARIRVEEIAERLRTLHAAPLHNAVSEEQVGQAMRAATSARVYSAKSSNRARRAHEGAIELHEAAAAAHDAAAAALDRLVAAGLGDVEVHERMSERHRLLAATDRAAADLERGRLRAAFPESG